MKTRMKDRLIGGQGGVRSDAMGGQNTGRDGMIEVLSE
jgi:hypothetical protein